MDNRMQSPHPDLYSWIRSRLVLHCADPVHGSPRAQDVGFQTTVDAGMARDRD